MSDAKKSAYRPQNLSPTIGTLPLLGSVIALLTLTALGVSTPATAQDEGMEFTAEEGGESEGLEEDAGPTEPRYLFVGLGLGPAVLLDNWPTQVRIEEEIGFNFEGRPEGFFLSFAPSQSFGDNVWVLTFDLRPGYMFSFFRSADLVFQAGAAVNLGLGLRGCDPCGTDAYFHMSFAVMFRVLLLEERLGIFLRPIEIEGAIGDPTSAARYLLSAGGQFFF